MHVVEFGGRVVPKDENEKLKNDKITIPTINGMEREYYL